GVALAGHHLGGKLTGHDAAEDAAPGHLGAASCQMWQPREAPSGGRSGVRRSGEVSQPSTWSRSRVASAGSSAAKMARITAAPVAPAARVAGTVLAVTPPIASTGTRAAAAAWRGAATPCGGPNAAFDGVAYTGPKKTKSAVALAASAGACVDTPTNAPGGRSRRATSAGSEPPPRWTPSAPTATATSIRSFTRRSAPARAV